ncbi:MAG: 2-dehydropantoate 2-reductase [Halieaceae bacterium]|jgi:2-dehydropantoate 2-reductase|nr:2-dehydropantoate 2-reductase [Halieaceae bacterium]
MKVCIIGCGAIGSLFGAHLGKLNDVEVWAYDPYQAHVDAINEQGLRLTGESDFVAKINARSDAGDIPPCELGIIASKTLHTRAAMEAVAPIFVDGAVCSVQNGVGSEEIIADYVPRVIMGTTFPAGHISGPGVCNHDTKGLTTIGPFDGKPATQAECERLAEALTRGGMETNAVADPRGPMWTKVIFNCASNGVAALTRLPHGIACEQVRDLMSAVAQEGVAVARALGVQLEKDPEEMIDYGKKVAYLHKPSMLQDVEAGRITEIDAINGGVAAIGEKVGVPCPLNRAIADMVKGLEFSWTLEA